MGELSKEKWAFTNADETTSALYTTKKSSLSDPILTALCLVSGVKMPDVQSPWGVFGSWGKAVTVQVILKPPEVIKQKKVPVFTCVRVLFPGEPVVHADSLAQLGSKDDMSGDSHGCW